MKKLYTFEDYAMAGAKATCAACIQRHGPWCCLTPKQMEIKKPDVHRCGEFKTLEAPNED